MGSFTIWHWVIVIVLVVVHLIPAARIVHRIGITRWYAVLLVLPLASFVALWVLAYMPWPIEKRTARSTSNPH